jgi:phage repressor protein C with HTH and peptisase S24 domain
MGKFPNEAVGGFWDNSRMNSQHEDVLARINEKLEQQGLNDYQASLAVTGKADFIRDLRRKKGLPRGDNLEKLAEVLGTSTRWILHGIEPQPVVRTEVAAANLGDLSRSYRYDEPLPKPVPLLGSAIGGEYGDIDEHIELTELDLGDVLDWLTRTPEVEKDPDAYALTVIGDSMSPLFEPATRVMVSPRQQIAIHDNVVVQLRGADGSDDRVKMVLIKRIVRRSANFVELRQFNPDLTFRVDIRRVAAIHKVVSARF